MNKWLHNLNLLNTDLGKEQNWIKIFVFSSIIFHLLAAYFNIGHLHPDEHYQIIEFANYKLGNIDSSYLAWEYNAELRPSLQPLICMALLKFINIFTDNPYTQVIFLRFVASASSLLAIWFLVKNIPERFNTKWSNLIIVLFSFSIWYLPFVHSRFSSETGSAIFMILGLVYFFKFEEKRKLLYVLLAGLFWGLSFEFRFQAGIMILFYGLWILIYRFKDLKIHLLQIVSFAIVVLLALGLDYYFYGELVFPPYNYFVANIVDDVASSYGVSPWDHYFLIMKRRSFEPISILKITTLLYLIIYQRKHIITWLIVPFIIFHSIIPHKETRFLFPVLYLVPYAISLAFFAFRKTYLDPGEINISFFKQIDHKERTNGIVIKYKIVNILIILWITMLPLSIWKSVYPANFRTGVLSYLYDNYNECTLLNILPDGQKSSRLEPRFYLKEGIINRYIFESEIETVFAELKKPVFVSYRVNRVKNTGRLILNEITTTKPLLYNELRKKKKLQIADYHVLYEVSLPK